ncbi:MAG: dTMP kinase [Bacteroidales bacterium]|jgi:dTMP kinase|nr:dTMP kinase [Bacteroidales bacterium]
MKLIVIEGLDGAGKSTQISLLKEWFAERNLQCRYIHFPRTDAPYFGELIARFLRGEFGNIDSVDPYLVAMLYAGDRKDAAPMIETWLEEKYFVILDRYTYSNIAYQCAKMNSEPEVKRLKDWIMNLEFVHFAIPKPDINIFLDVPFRFTEEKLKNRRQGDDRSYLLGSADIHESSLAFQKRVRDIYIEVAANDEKLQVIDCQDSENSMAAPEVIFGLILDKLREKNILR